MAKYITHQRKILLEFIERHADEPISAGQIASALKAENISQSAVYRNLSMLEIEGKVRRVSRNGSRNVFYQYADGKCKSCIHMSCKKCGKTFHMGMSMADFMIRNVQTSERFVIDTTDTVIYGICKGCI